MVKAVRKDFDGFGEQMKICLRLEMCLDGLQKLLNLIS